MYTNKTRPVPCPVCEGEGGEMVLYGGMYGSGEDEEWAPCETCETHGTVERMERLAFLIGEARKFEAALASLKTVTKAEPIAGSAAPYLLRKAA